MAVLERHKPTNTESSYLHTLQCCWLCSSDMRKGWHAAVILAFEGSIWHTTNMSGSYRGRRLKRRYQYFRTVSGKSEPLFAASFGDSLNEQLAWHTKASIRFSGRRFIPQTIFEISGVFCWVYDVHPLCTSNTYLESPTVSRCHLRSGNANARHKPY